MNYSKFKNSILFFCAIPPPIGGQALISEIIYKAVKPRYLINTNIVNKYSGTFIILIKICWILLFCKVDLVYFTCTRSKKGAFKDLILLFFCKIRNIKVINHLHGNDMPVLFNGRGISSILYRLYKHVDTTIFVTEMQKQYLPKSFNEMKRIVIPNCYDPILENAERTLDKKRTEIGVLFVSNLMKSKGIFLALDVFEMVALEYKNAVFHIAGKPMGDYLMSLDEVKILFDLRMRYLSERFPGRFHYHGVVIGEKKKKIFLDSDIFLFPSFHKGESFGIVNIEAMRTGNVVIATKNDFIIDIISEKEGFLVEPQNIEETIRAVRYLLDHPAEMREIQEHNIKLAKELYSPDIFKKAIREVFTLTAGQIS